MEVDHISRLHCTEPAMNDEFSLLDNLKWTPDARAKFYNIPFFVRSEARRRIEQLAHDAETDIVTAEIVEQARSMFGQ